MVKRFLILLSLVVVMAAFAFIAPRAAEAASIEVTLIKPPAGGDIHLTVGETYTLTWTVNSDTEFINAFGMPSLYYPGRGITMPVSDHTAGGTSATVTISFTGKGTTANFEHGYQPLTVFVGARYQGGVKLFEQFDFQVYVTE